MGVCAWSHEALQGTPPPPPPPPNTHSYEKQAFDAAVGTDHTCTAGVPRERSRKGYHQHDGHRSEANSPGTDACDFQLVEAGGRHLGVSQGRQRLGRKNTLDCSGRLPWKRTARPFKQIGWSRLTAMVFLPNTSRKGSGLILFK